MSYLRSAAKRVFERKAQGCKSSLKSACIRTALVAVRKALVMMVKGLVMSGRVKTGSLVKVACSFLNAVSHSVVQSHFALFLVRSWRGQAIVEKSRINFSRSCKI